MLWKCGIGLKLVLNWFWFDSNLFIGMAQFEEVWRCENCEHCQDNEDSDMWYCFVWNGTVWYHSLACKYFEERVETW